MFVYRTDAPLYYWPIATVMIIVANFGVMAYCLAYGFNVNQYSLQYGVGLKPEQWFTSLFLHDGPMHVLGNMVFFWVFGLIVEGKIGWWKFLLLYLSIGVSQSAVEQYMMLGAMPGGGSVGSSAAIFGVMVVAMIWAPENELDGILFVGVWGFFLTLKVSVFCVIYLGWEFFIMAITGFALGGALLHLMGALMGAIFGVGMLKLKLVDCEGWDLFALMAGRLGEREDEYHKPKKKTKEAEEEVEPPPRAMSQGEAEKFIKDLLDENKPLAAIEVYKRKIGHDSTWQMPDEELLRLIVALEGTKQWEYVTPLMRRHIELYPSKAEKMTLRLAEILLRYQSRPRQAINVLETLRPPLLNPKLEAARLKIETVARREAEEGAVEMASEEW